MNDILRQSEEIDSRFHENDENDENDENRGNNENPENDELFGSNNDLENDMNEKTYNNKDKYFSGQQKDEEIILIARRHPIVLLRHIAGMIALLIVFPMIIYGIKTLKTNEHLDIIQAIFFTLFIFFTIYTHRFFLTILNHYLRVVILTNYRIIELNKTIFIHNNKDTIDLYKIQDLKIQQNGVLCTLFNFGTLTVEVSAIHETKCIKLLPNPDKWFKKINQTKRKYIEKRQRNYKSVSQIPITSIENSQPIFSSETLTFK